MSGTVWIALLVLLGALILELFSPEKMAEGFQAIGLTPKVYQTKPSIISNLITPRGDVGPGKELSGYIQDGRYFADYADVQRYGQNKDFCRVVSLSGEDFEFFACALAGTAGTSPYGYRTKNKSQGLKLSRDDYMRAIAKDGRAAYCRILKMPDATFQPMCLRALDYGFNDRDEMDPDPPEDIKTMLDFYSGCQMWLRFRDDMLDYIGKATLQLAGGINIDETPRPTVSRGLFFNGIDQYVRLGDSSELSLGNQVQMRSIRAWSVWVNFNEFTNNAKIFDFGDGAGNNNVFLGILGRGEGGAVAEALRPGPKCDATTVPTTPSGAQWCPEMRPQDLLQISSGNIDEYVCTVPEVVPRRLPPSQTRPPPAGGLATRATLQYEVWDQRLRKVQIKVNRAIPLKQWAHIVITATSSDAMRPDLAVYVNGNILFTQEQGYLPQAKVTSNNYLGKSNWANDFSQYELRDELFSGSMFDFRMYSTPLSESKIKRILQYGMGKLGLDTSFLSVSG